MPRSATTARMLTDRILQGRLAEELRTRRAAGESFETIARWLSDAHDVHVAGESIRRWCITLDIESEPKAASA